MLAYEFRGENMDDFLISVPFKAGREQVTSRSYRYDNLTRDDTCFVIVQRTISGVGAFYLRGKREEVPEGYAFLAIVPEPSSYAYEGPARVPWVFSWLNFYGGPSAAMARQIRDLHGPVLPLAADSVAGKRFELLLERPLHADPLQEAADAYLFLICWVQELGRDLAKNAHPLQASIRKMETRFHEPLGVKQLAAEAGLSREHFSRLFVETTGVSPASYLRAIRLGHARRLLGRKSNTLKETALRCGFPSAAALRRALDQTGG
jgi:AraC-like DNA-binding protein